jgi:hypothetical protein
MTTTWIYVFSDSGYPDSVKVGRSSTKHGAWDDAPCYAPRPLMYISGWEVPLSLKPGLTKHTAANQVESAVARSLGVQLTYPRNGREWYRAAPEDAEKKISAILGQSPHVRNGQSGIIVKNDQFRNPKPDKVGSHGFKVALWIYREHLTDRLKIQVIDDWRTPFEVRRRYSRNGFEELAAFSYVGQNTGSGNEAVQGAWLSTMRTYGPGIEDHFYGWLRHGAELSDVVDHIKRTGLVSLPTNRHVRPEGVRLAYNKSP